MVRKFSELSESEKVQFIALVDFMKETLNEDIRIKINIIKRFNLDIQDDAVMDFLTGVSVLQLKDDLKTEPLRCDTEDSQDVKIEKNALVTLKHEHQVKNTREKKIIYSDEWIVMQNRLLHAISHLSLNERRLILFLSPLVRQEISKNEDVKNFTILASDFSKTYNIRSSNVYSILSDVADSILTKAFWYWNFKDNKPFGKKTHRSGVSWVVKCDYMEKQGAIEIILSDDVINMLTIFDKANPFTKYQKEWITKLGVYGIILLELILSCMHQKFKQKAYTVEYLREKFDCFDKYKTMVDFRRYVIDLAVKEIHENTPIRMSYQQKKIGRVVTEIVFSFEDTSQQVLTNKKEAHQLTQDTYKNFKMTKKQLNFFGGKIATELGKDIEAVIQDLTNVYLQNQYIDMLKQLNYVPTKYFTDKEIAKQPTLQAIEQQQAEQKRIIKEREVKEQVNKEALQAKFAEDLVKLKQHAKEFALANRHLINSYGIDRHYFDNKEYDSLIAYCWKEQLTDPKQRKYFRLLDEILAR